MRKIVGFVLLICVIFAFSGCDLWLSGDYSKVVPHVIPDAQDQTDKVEVADYDGLCDAILSAVTSGMQEALIHYPKADLRRVSADMDAAVNYVIHEHPVGAYAVSQIDYEIGTSGGVQAVSLQITYTRGIAQIRKLQSVSDLEAAKAMIADALAGCEASVVFYMDRYDGTDFIQFVSDYVEENPDLCMELPQTSAVT